MNKIKTVLHLTDGTDMEFPYNHGSNLPLMFLTGKCPHQQGLHVTEQANFCNNPRGIAFMRGYASLLHKSNINLTAPQKELLLIHHKWGHAYLRWCQSLMCKKSDGSEPLFHPKYPAIANLDTTHLQCDTCVTAKATKVGHMEAERAAQFQKMMIRKGDLKPGDMVSLDQYHSSTPGRLPDSAGKEHLANCYHGGTLMFDHSSEYIHLHNQVSLNIGETLQGICAFEQFGSNYCVKIKK